MDAKHNDLRDVVCQLLKADQLKLWLPPYTMEDGFSAGMYGPEMVSRYAEVCGASQEEVVAMLESLRQHAIEKLSLRRAGVETASRIEVGEPLTVRVAECGGGERTVNLVINLQRPGKELYELVGKKTSQSLDSFRLIFSNSVVDHAKPLCEQGVRANSVFMALPLSVEELRRAGVAAAEQNASHLRDVAASLADREDDGQGRYLEICDQHGQPIAIPDQERRSLTLALTLHQKGRRLLHNGSSEGDYQQALALLKECDREFQQCRSSILQMVDNHGVLFLDICWCQLLLRDIESLPEAEHRLAQCEHVLRKTHGANGERLALHKGGKTGAENLLYGRLHLLQAVVAHFTGRPNAAKELLERSATELGSLEVKTEHMVQLLAVTGCTEESARVSLRACRHDVDLAVQQLIEKEEERRQGKKLIEQKFASRRRGKALGRVADGSGWLDADKYGTLCSMGYPKILCQISLKQCNNNLSAALNALQHDRDVLEAEAVEIYREQQQQHGSHTLDNEPPPPDDDVVASVVSMGFEDGLVRAGLRHFNMQVEPLVDYLLSQSSLGEVSFPASDTALGQELAASLLLDPETFPKKDKKEKRTRRDESGSASALSEEERRQKELDVAIETDLVPDIAEEGDIEYLDSTLEQERTLLHEYRSIIYGN